MIYLTTGGNGACKTLFTLRDVREQQLKENRPVFYHGFEAKQPLKDFGWLPFDPAKWQDLPDGAICIFDECQNEFPSKISGDLPDYINAVAQFRRKRGFDFWMITPHPSMIHVNIRRLIAAPSWHRHLKRNFGGKLVSHLRFNQADMKCEEPGAGSRGEVTMHAMPTEVFDWYESASLHTGKKRLPKQVYMLGAAAIAVPAMMYFAISGVYGNVTKKVDPASAQKLADVGTTAARQGGGAPAVLTTAEYVKSVKPRIAGFPHTAPRYDEITRPTVAPYPAACIVKADDCRCYTQQATLMVVPDDICRQIVQKGYFVDWQQPQQPVQERTQQVAQEQPKQPRTVPAPGAPAVVDEFAQWKRDKEVNEAMTALAIRNAGPRMQTAANWVR